MRPYLIILFIIILSTGRVNSQPFPQYEMTFTNYGGIFFSNDFVCKFSFCGKQKYVLELCFDDPSPSCLDFSYCWQLSTGIFKKKESEYILNDEVFKYNIKMNLHEKKLEVKEGFPFLEGRYFNVTQFFDTQNCKEDMFTKNFYGVMWKKPQDNITDSPRLKCPEGIYTVYYTKDFPTHQIKLSSASQYTLEINNLLISSGKCNVEVDFPKPNKLVFTDKNLKYSFFGLYQTKEDIIISIFFPGVYMGSVFVNSSKLKK